MDDVRRQAIKEMLARRSREHTRTPELAQQWLIDEGLFDRDGNLRPQFGGEGAAEDQR